MLSVLVNRSPCIQVVERVDREQFLRNLFLVCWWSGHPHVVWPSAHTDAGPNENFQISKVLSIFLTYDVFLCGEI